MDLKRLENFLKIAELGSLSRVADRMRVAQPALSRQMRLLEEEIGAPLFARHHRGMQLTAAGEELQQRLAGPLRQVRQAIADVRATSGAAEGAVALGMPPSVSYILAGGFARRVAEQAPNLSLRIVEGYAGHLIDWIQRGEIDAAILYGPAADLQMSVDDLLIERLMLVGSADSDLVPELRVDLRDLDGMPLVLPSHPHGVRVILESAARRVKADLNVKFEADSFLVLKELVECGLGYTVLPLSSLSREVEAGRLRCAPLVKPSVMRQLVLGAPGRANMSRAASTVVGLLRDEIRALVQSGHWQAQLQF